MRLHPHTRWIVALAFAALTALPAARASADPVGPTPDSAGSAPSFGTASLSSLTLGAFAFSPTQNNVTWGTSFIDNTVVIYHTGVSSNREATFDLPNGALIEEVGIRFCDSTPTSFFDSRLRIEDSSGAAPQPIPLVTSTVAETPGCVYRTVTLAPAIQVDNAAKVYTMELSLDPAAGDQIAFGHARVRYRLQVSPAPATGTFGDVPTDHPFFQYIEALAAAGITGGCGGGNYCPDNPLTRGQMAVFLAKALGLHFPN